MSALALDVPWRRGWLFALALVIGLFNLGSYVYFVVASRNLIEVQQERAVPRYELGETVSWLGKAPASLLGWWPSGADGTWSVGARSAFEVIPSVPSTADLQLEVLAAAFVHPDASAREVAVFANGSEVARWQVGRAAATHTARIPAALASASRLRIEFRPEEVSSPVDLRLSADYRKLGIEVKSWKLVAAP